MYQPRLPYLFKFSLNEWINAYKFTKNVKGKRAYIKFQELYKRVIIIWHDIWVTFANIVT